MPFAGIYIYIYTQITQKRKTKKKTIIEKKKHLTPVCCKYSSCAVQFGVVTDLLQKRHDLCHGKVQLHGACQQKVINISMAGIYEDTWYMISFI